MGTPGAIETVKNSGGRQGHVISLEWHQEHVNILKRIRDTWKVWSARETEEICIGQWDWNETWTVKWNLDGKRQWLVSCCCCCCRCCCCCCCWSQELSVSTRSKKQAWVKTPQDNSCDFKLYKAMGMNESKDQSMNRTRESRWRRAIALARENQVKHDGAWSPNGWVAVTC